MAVRRGARERLCGRGQVCPWHAAREAKEGKRSRKGKGEDGGTGHWWDVFHLLYPPDDALPFSPEVLLVSLMWQVLVPVSFVLSLGLPMFISYIVWGNPFWSPVGLSLLLIAPLKWLPCVQWVWLL